MVFFYFKQLLPIITYNNMNDYYVYALLDTRKIINKLHLNYYFGYEPFYIGLGQNNRINMHLTKHELSFTHTIKVRKILSIYEDNYYVLPIFLRNNLTSQEAIKLEINLIKYFGRINKKTGILTNLTDGGEGVRNISYTEEQLEYKSIIMSGENNPTFGRKYNLNDFKSCKKILQKDINTGEIIKEFISASTAEKETNITHILDVCRGERLSAGGYDWEFKDFNINKTIKRSGKRHGVLQIDINTNEIINCYNSVNQAEIAHKIYNLKYICESDNNIYKGFKWAYTTPINKTIINDNKLKKKIIQLDRNKNVIQKFNSVKEASLFTNIPRANISLNLTKITRSAGGFIWIYEDNK